LGFITRKETPVAHIVRRGNRSGRGRGSAAKAIGIGCESCRTANRADANFCIECGTSLASAKTARALRSAGYYDALTVEEQDVIYKRVGSNPLTKAAVRTAEADVLRGYLDSPDPTERLAAQRGLAEMGYVA
jgi:hypothetical protein